MFKVGVVENFFQKTGVVVIRLQNRLSVNDNIKFLEGGKEVFSQKVELLKIGHKGIDSADRGSIVILKTDAILKKETEVFKI